ncbi:uncharacterized protein LOC9637396 [Selaginella moellendorffii]|nr:uncharacterized protein LOC9637396 [Selaginella moellendorffii]|eukprot:XP_024535221.1 uncharacterized protein LOC9637396 [Selaginella moellendorffii]
MAAYGVCVASLAGGGGGIGTADKEFLRGGQAVSVSIRIWPRRHRLASRFRAVRASTAVAEEAAAESPTPAAKQVQRLKSQYLDKVVPAMMEEFSYTNTLQVPKLNKIVVNCGNGEGAQNAKILEAMQKDLSLITGQKPIVTRAKKAVAAFKLRKDVPVGIAVTLRGEVMYSFLDRLVNLAFPRTRDFQGVSPYSFDGKGNYNVGISDQSVFPEIKFESIDQQRGFDVAICTSANSDKEGQRLLSLLGMPFKDDAVKPPKKRKSGKWNVKGAKGGGRPVQQKTKAKAKKKK